MYSHSRNVTTRTLPWWLVCLALVSGLAHAATLNVTTTDDELNDDGDCSLREAVNAANNDTATDTCPSGDGLDTIILPAGTYVLALAGMEEDNNTTGDLDIRSDVTLVGAGTASTIIDANALDRVVHIGGGTTVSISLLTIRNGFLPEGALSGAGILNQGALTLEQVAIRDNFLTGNDVGQGFGGGISNCFQCNLTLTDSTVSDNTADNGGGISNGGTLVIQNSTINGNRVDISGAGITNSSQMTLTNTTISGNSANSGGGGIFQAAGEATLRNVTISGNSLSGSLGGALFLGQDATMSIGNSILAGNRFADCDIRGATALVSLGNNLDGDNSCGFTAPGDIGGSDPLLGALADNGGATFTHALLAGSPAIDAGADTDCPATDQRGETRPADGNGDATAHCDIGAYERQAAAQAESTTIFASVLPGSRSLQLGATATAFAAIVNGGTETAIACSIIPLGNIPNTVGAQPAAFAYQTTDPLTNALTGTPDTPADIPPGGLQSFVFAITPATAFAPLDVGFRFQCANSPAAPVITGLNSLLLSASTNPVSDIVALSATQSGDGIVNLPGDTGANAFAVATVNVGSQDAITASADTGTATLPVTLSICESDPVTGGCLAPPTPSVTTSIDAGATPTFSIFVTGSGAVPFDPAANRIFVRFKDAGDVTCGSTSVAVRTL
jgi:CSLREA domain-containing protein